MIKQIGERWRGFWRMANNLALAMDADPLEDIHRRVRQLERAGREPVGTLHGSSEALGGERMVRK
jgi:hypothetical protein